MTRAEASTAPPCFSPQISQRRENGSSCSPRIQSADSPPAGLRLTLLSRVNKQNHKQSPMLVRPDSLDSKLVGGSPRVCVRSPCCPRVFQGTGHPSGLREQAAGLRASGAVCAAAPGRASVPTRSRGRGRAPRFPGLACVNPHACVCDSMCMIHSRAVLVLIKYSFWLCRAL